MASFIRSSPFVILTLGLTLGTILNINAVKAQSSPSGSSSLGDILEKSFSPPPGQGLPENRQGGASRGPCFEDSRKLTALVPTTIGETAAEYPTVFWYMPKMTHNGGVAPAPHLEFKLKNANGKDIYSYDEKLTKYTDGSVGTSGIMSLALAKPLEVGQEYKWELRVKCDAEAPDRSQDQFVEGIFKRVAPDPNLELRVQQASPEDRLILYAQANRWYEMLATLVALRKTRPNDPIVTNAWNKLFAGVDLDTVTIQSRSQGTSTTDNN